MTIHKEGYKIILITIILALILNIVSYVFISNIIIVGIIFSFSIGLLGLILNFFRSPCRKPTIEDRKIIAPADGKVVVIEEVEETEFFKEKRVMVSIFMSVYNVHINWFPVAGIVKYFKHHHGIFLVAWHPKSSEENERTTLVVENKNGVSILFRQIAGALARRIVCYAKEGEEVTQSSEMGFIKFGSRVDVYMPLGTEVNVKIDDKVTGSQTVIATLQ